MAKASTLRRARRSFRERRRLWAERARAVTAAPHPSPVLVFGNQKSGTSAVAALLAEAAGLEARIDFAGGWEPYLGRVLRGETSITAFVKANAWAFSAPVVKEPGLTFFAVDLLDHFGLENGVFIVRNPWANIRSILNRLGLRGDGEAVDLDALPNRTWRSVVTGADLGLPADGYIATLARRWARAAEVYLSTPERFHLVRYEDFNAAKAETIEALAAAMRLEVRNDITASLDKAFQRPGRPVDDLGAFFGAANSARIGELCSAQARALGYAAP